MFAISLVSLLFLVNSYFVPWITLFLSGIYVDSMSLFLLFEVYMHVLLVFFDHICHDHILEVFIFQVYAETWDSKSSTMVSSVIDRLLSPKNKEMWEIPWKDISY